MELFTDSQIYYLIIKFWDTTNILYIGSLVGQRSVIYLQSHYHFTTTEWHILNIFSYMNATLPTNVNNGIMFMKKFLILNKLMLKNTMYSTSTIYSLSPPSFF